LLLGLALPAMLSYGQTTISGQITDREDSKVLPYVSVIIYRYQSNKILAYTQTDTLGHYSLRIKPGPQVVTLKTSRLGYRPFVQDIVIGAGSARAITLSFALAPAANELQEVVIQGPVIVKEDTIIYDVGHWTEARDQTLAEVLAKIPGFKIRGDGEIEVNGKMIDKVLIDGQEVANTGAAMLTRSIAPEDVENVEVRLDEKNDKLKESLLDTREYVVLDIKLKAGLNKALFGKLRATMGYQDSAEPGGYVNAFSLKKKLKVHLFAEHDRFGEQTISLDKIKNIGAEAFRKIFEIPADFESLTEREAFNDEIYGFKNYTVADKDIAGLSSKYSLSPAIDLYFGTYNGYTKDGQARNYAQRFNEASPVSSFAEAREMTGYSSKNKLDFRLDKNKLKARLDLNAVIFKNTNTVVNSETRLGLNYDFSDVHNSQAFYQNLLVEYKFNPKLGLQFKASHSYIEATRTKTLRHNNPLYVGIFYDENNAPVYDFAQETVSQATNFISGIMVQYRGKLGAINTGIRFQGRGLTAGKNGFHVADSVSSTTVPLFTGARGRLNFQKWTPFIKHRITAGSFTFDNEVRLARMSYPNPTNGQKSQQQIEFKLGVNYSPGSFNYINIALSRQVSSYPMQKLIEGYDISGFQAIAIPNRYVFSPTQEYTLEILAAKEFAPIGLLLDPAILYGRTQNTDRFLFSTDPVIITEYDQLQAEYWALSFPFRKSFKKLPMVIIFEPEGLINQMQNLDSAGTSYQTRTTRVLMGLKLNTDFNNLWFDFNLYPKYTAFIFGNPYFNTSRKLEMFAVNFTAKIDLFDEKLLLTPAIRAVTFVGNVAADFTNISIKIAGPAGKFYWFVVADNLLNSTGFVIERIFPTYAMLETNSVFARFVKLGLEYKFK